MHRLISKTSLFIIVILLLSMIISSCSYLPLPEEVMRPPLGDIENGIKVDADRFIPQGMVVLTAGNSNGRYQMRFTDIENDGLDELVVFYVEPGEYSFQ